MTFDLHLGSLGVRRGSLRALAGALLATALLSAAGTASAAKGKCPSRAEAKRAFDTGHLAYRRGAYEEAILKFQDSYGLCEQPLTLLAIANAYERLGDLAAALEHLQRYRPDAAKREHDEIDSRIATLESRVEEQKAEEQRKLEQEQRREQKRKQEEEARRKAEEARAAEEASDRPLMWAGWVTGGVGVALLGVSVVTGALALSLDGDLSDSCVDGRCPADREEDIDQLGSLSAATDVLLVLGSVLTASGVTMLLLDSSSEASPSVGITFGPGAASVRGSF